MAQLERGDPATSGTRSEGGRVLMLQSKRLGKKVHLRLRRLEEADYERGFMELLSELTVTPAVSKRAFLARLKERPQLPNDFFSIDVVLRDLVEPGYTRGDAYTEHFDRILFGRRFLGEGCWPTLLVNVTDYESGRQKVYY